MLTIEDDLCVRLRLTNGSSVVVPAVGRYGCMVIHDAVGLEGWAVTHHASGFRVWQTRGLGDAIKVARYLDEIGVPAGSDALHDWITRMTGKATLLLVSRLQEMAPRLVAED